ncbi:hypothetical protein FOG64_15485 [Salmonella enterica]|nr:hypothetical protein [Salmonella enterica]ECU9462687.1 hypothetical protein [Salmonella enterica subsp. enterica serovar Bareilly]
MELKRVYLQFDVNAREALSNPHQAAIDVKKPVELVLCGLSVLHRTYPDHYLVELAESDTKY